MIEEEQEEGEMKKVNGQGAFTIYQTKKGDWDYPADYTGRRYTTAEGAAMGAHEEACRVAGLAEVQIKHAQAAERDGVYFGGSGEIARMVIGVGSILDDFRDAESGN